MLSIFHPPPRNNWLVLKQVDLTVYELMSRIWIEVITGPEWSESRILCGRYRMDVLYCA